MEYDRVSLEDWQRHQPLSILQLDTADRVVLRVAGESSQSWLQSKENERVKMLLGMLHRKQVYASTEIIFLTSNLKYFSPSTKSVLIVRCNHHKTHYIDVTQLRHLIIIVSFRSYLIAVIFAIRYFNLVIKSFLVKCV